ncbi:hypothetical protein RRG08_004122 [Elysia crispata]|uniref:Uncharacterized protein n=1 Tax=Elysia crispata TaxID=231223 RepID=A0AAE0YX61_9GAST|nr:hypothetical protein RRG08_004122 [Elysia crispata]
MGLQLECALITIIFLSIKLPVVSGSNGYKEYSYNLLNSLTDPKFYQSNVIPVTTESSNVSMTMQLQVLSIVAVSEKEQTLMTNNRLFMRWSDAYLSWDPSSFGNITSILLGQDTLWLPDVTVANTVQPSVQIGFPGLPCRVFHTGRIEWNPGVIIWTSCDLDVTYFPMDTQVCHILFETMTSWYEEVQIQVDEAEPIVLEQFKQNGQWDLIDSWGSSTYGLKERNRITFSFLLKRRRAYYLLNIVIPVLLLSFTGTLSLALPADAGEKMGMCLTVLLSYTVYLTIVSEELPNTSVQISVLSVYLTVLIAITTSTVGMTTIILRLHHKPETESVGPGTQKLVRILKKLTCTAKEDTPPKNSVSPVFVRRELTETTDTDTLGSRSTKVKDLCSDAISQEGIDTLTWQEVSKTLDCFLFLVMSSLSVLSTITVFVILFIGSEINKPDINR